MKNVKIHNNLLILFLILLILHIYQGFVEGTRS